MLHPNKIKSMNSFRFLFPLLSLLLLVSCLKGDFDTPPTQGKDPDIPVDEIISLSEVF